MSVFHVTLESETERWLRVAAASKGMTPEAYLRQLAERDAADAASRPRRTFEEVSRPFAEAVAAEGMTEEEVFEFFTKSVKEVRAERRAREGTNP